MASTLVVVGPGRVGQALARAWREHGAMRVLLLSRHADRAAARFVGAEVSQDRAVLRRAVVVLVSVPDPAVAEVVAECAAAGVVRRCALWLHASGSLGVDALEPARACGARVGLLHPLCPFPSPDLGYRHLRGAAATVSGPTESLRLLTLLAKRAGLDPVPLPLDADRARYHAACALLANGVTVLAELATRAFSHDLPAADAKLCADSLLAGAAQACRELGPLAALTGPAVRGDAATLARHLRALGRRDLARAPYLALMRAAAALGRARGSLAKRQLDAVLAALEDDRG